MRLKMQKRSRRSGGRRGGAPGCIAHAQAGYSLTELMTVILILGITLTASIPAFSRFMQSNNLRDAAMQFAGHFRLARSMAVASGVPYIVDWDLDTERYEVVRDDNNNGAPDIGEPATGPFPLPKHVILQNPNDEDLRFSSTRVVFTRSGSASESGMLLLSNDRGHSKSLLLLAPTGQVRVE